MITNIEDDINIRTFVNFLLLGRTGTGKSTLLNLLLEEMKSLEGGNGFSTTSKNIIVYKKKGFPFRFYDVKGIENEKTAENHFKLMTQFNVNNYISYDSINVIFYCIEYKDTWTIFEEIEFKVFEKLIKFEKPIIFIITKTPYDPNIISKNNKLEINRENERNIIINAIKDLIKYSFNNIKKENESQKLEKEIPNTEDDEQKFIDKYIKIFFVNLVRMKKEVPVPVFGIDKVLSSLSELVLKNKWDDLEFAWN